jgi:hypothetical protein
MLTNPDHELVKFFRLALQHGNAVVRRYVYYIEHTQVGRGGRKPVDVECLIGKSLDRLLAAYDFPWNEQPGLGRGRGVYMPCPRIRFVVFPAAWMSFAFTRRCSSDVDRTYEEGTTSFLVGLFFGKRPIHATKIVTSSSSCFPRLLLVLVIPIILVVPILPDGLGHTRPRSHSRPRGRALSVHGDRHGALFLPPWLDPEVIRDRARCSPSSKVLLQR